MSTGLTDEEIEALEKQQAPSIGLSDEEINHLEAASKQPQVQGLTDEQMAALEQKSAASIQQETEQPKNIAFTPIFSEDRVKEIAQKRGVDPDSLMNWAGMLGAYIPAGDQMKAITAAANDAGVMASMADDIAIAGFGKKAAVKLIKQFQDNPDAWEQAADDLRQEVEERKSGIRKATELGVGIGTAIASGGATAATRGGTVLKALDMPASLVAGTAGKLTAAPLTALGKIAPNALKPALALGEGVAHGAGGGAALGALGGLAETRGDESLYETGKKVGHGAAEGTIMGAGFGLIGGALQAKKVSNEIAEKFKEANLGKGEVNPTITPDTIKNQLTDKDAIIKDVMEKQASGAFEPPPELKDQVTEKELIKEELTKRGIDLAEYNNALNDVSSYAASGKVESGLKGNIEDIRNFLVQNSNKEFSFSSLYDEAVSMKRTYRDSIASASREVTAANEGADTFAANFARLGDNMQAFSEIGQRLNAPAEVTLSLLSKANQAGKADIMKQMEPLLLGNKDSLSSVIIDAGGSERLQKLLPHLENKPITEATIKEVGKLAGIETSFKDYKAFKAINEFNDRVFSLMKDTYGYKGLERINQEGELYIKQQLKAGDEIPAAWDRELRRLEKEGVNWKKPETLDLENPEVRNLINGLEVTSGQEVRAGEDALNLPLYKKLLGLDGSKGGTVWDIPVKRGSYGQEAGSLMEREREIPTFLREWDPFKLSMSYLNQMATHAATSSIAGEVRALRNLAAVKGDIRSMNTIDTLLTNMRGDKPGSAAAWGDQLMTGINAGLKREAQSDNIARAATAKTLLTVGDMVGTLSSYMHPNLLSGPRAAVQNHLQLVYQLVPEVGFLNGGQLFVRSLGNYMLDAIKGKIGERLKNWGDAPFDRNLQLEHLKKGILESSVSGTVKRGLLLKVDQLNDLSMMMFKHGETFNTYLANAIGEKLIGQMGNKLPNNSFARSIYPGFREGINKALASGDKEAATRLMQEYLVQKTVFRFDRSTQAEAATFMGKLFSSFSKYPTATYGDIRWNLIRKDIGTWDKGYYLTRKYLAPIGLGMMANQLVWEKSGGPDKEDEPMAYTLLGQGGFMNPAQITSVWNILKEGWQGPPALSLGSALVKGSAKVIGDLSDSEKGMDEVNFKPLMNPVATAASIYLPLMNYWNLVGSQLPGLMGEVEGRGTLLNPEGPTYKHPVKRLLNPAD